MDPLRAQIAFATNRGSDASPLLLKAAERLDPLDVRLAREIYLDALSAAIFAGRLASGSGARKVAEAARAAHPSPQPPRASDLLLDGLALLITEGHGAGAPTLKRALRAFRDGEISMEEGLRWLWVACHTAGLLWDYDSWDVLSDRLIQMARDAGALIALPIALSTRAGVCLFAGELALAASLVEEVREVTDVTQSSIAPYAAVGVAVFRGRDAEASELIERGKREVELRGEGEGLTFVRWASALLYNGLGRYDDALAAAEQAAEDSNEVWFSTWGLVELTEAAIRSGNRGRATGALPRLAATTSASGTDWGLGIEARTRALLSDGQTADALYREAIERLANTRIRVELARSHLLYGEWLRRERRRIDARQQLRTAHEMLTAMGLEAYAERARRELLATGEAARKLTVQTADQLTAQETQIARLARDGLSNPEIGARLFISPRTVEYHLRKVFTKLAITSRKDLHQAMRDGPSRATRSH